MLIITVRTFVSGLFSVLEKMIKMNVRPDVDTLEYYCLHLSDTSNLQQLITKLHNLGLSTREIVTPLLAYLLKHIQIESACNICRSYNIEISPDRLIKPLIKSWVSTKDARRTVQILKRMSINTNDHVGQFLIRAFRECKSSEDNKHFLHLLEASTKANIHISTTAVDVIINRLKYSKNTALINEIEAAVNKLSLKTLSSNNIPHPRQMNITELENHLIELESKEMETRGVLRRLISEYCRLGNYKKAFELRSKFIASGYEESPGMKTSMMHAYVLDENIYDALKMYTSLKDFHSNFVIDEFKIIDLASALVKNGQLKEA
ncbi:hypothetical protein FQR65_LT09774 [Abscondita terminalis]|nr:hypothetical protein FQR65_LT09774 [Abscondita terminalis]